MGECLPRRGVGMICIKKRLMPYRKDNLKLLETM